MKIFQLQNWKYSNYKKKIYRIEIENWELRMEQIMVQNTNNGTKHK